MNFISLDHKVHSIDDYDILCAIDQSTQYSSVYKAIDKKTGRIVAIKVINLVNQNDLAVALSTYKIRPFKNICQVFVCFGQDGKLFIVMEFFAGGSLKDLIKLFVQKQQTLTNEEIQVILKELLLGVQEIHQENLVHRHIKSANLLLSEKGKIKLSYFSTNKEFFDTINKSQSQILSLPYWLAPEVIVMYIKTIKSSISDQKSDIWAIGITAYELITGKIPYEDIPPQKVIFKIVQGPPPQLKNYPEEMLDFVNSCLKNNPEERPTINQLMNHPFIRAAKKPQLMYDIYEKYILSRGEYPLDNQQEHVYMHNRVVTSYQIDPNGAKKENIEYNNLQIKRTIRKIEKYKPGLAKAIFQEILQAYKEVEPQDAIFN
ncbi:hypothetical protein pb186bvf_011554 [Paramecium bursaria]